MSHSTTYLTPAFEPFAAWTAKEVDDALAICSDESIDVRERLACCKLTLAYFRALTGELQARAKTA
jgi:hypothetical protein